MVLTNYDQLAGRQRALDICRGVGRLLKAHGLASVTELPLSNGRRADVAGLTVAGEIWIVEVKSCPADFLGDQKWPDYREFCDRFFFAVAPDFPTAILPTDAGHIIADRYGGEIMRPAPETKLAGARRKAMTLRMFRTAAFRLQDKVDPGGFPPRPSERPNSNGPTEAGPSAAGIPIPDPPKPPDPTEPIKQSRGISAWEASSSSEP